MLVTRNFLIVSQKRSPRLKAPGWTVFQDKNRAFGMTEREEAIRETTGGPSPAPELVPSGVHVKGVLESLACDPDCRDPYLTEDPTLIVRNDQDLSPVLSPGKNSRDRSLLAFDRRSLETLSRQIDSMSYGFVSLFHFVDETLAKFCLTSRHFYQILD